MAELLAQMNHTEHERLAISETTNATIAQHVLSRQLASENSMHVLHEDIDNENAVPLSDSATSQPLGLLS